MPYTYDHPRAALSVDAVVFGTGAAVPHVLLVERARPPYAGCWALPGGFLELDETLAQAALRELREETGVTLEKMAQLRAFDALDRDPRERVISIAHVAVTAMSQHAPRGGDDAAKARWFALDALPPLAFDHAAVLDAARRWFEATAAVP